MSLLQTSAYILINTCFSQYPSVIETLHETIGKGIPNHISIIRLFLHSFFMYMIGWKTHARPEKCIMTSYLGHTDRYRDPVVSNTK